MAYVGAWLVLGDDARVRHCVEGSKALSNEDLVDVLQCVGARERLLL